MATKHLIGAVFGLGVATLALALPAAAENGVTADKIVFGQAAALDGPAGALGQGMRDGLLAAFAEANKAGGVKWPHAGADFPRRRLRAQQIDRRGEAIDRAGQGLRTGRLGRNADLGRGAADRGGGGRAVYRRVHRCRVPA